MGAAGRWDSGARLTQPASTLLVGAGMAEAMMPLMSLAHMVDKAKLSIARIDQILALAPLAEPPGRGLEPANADVRFESVNFRYSPDGPAALTGLSFVAPAGSITALVGPSGAGKTTVARLIPRFWDVSAGSIRVGGVDIRELDHDTLMRQVAFVFQDSFLFTGTIAENIGLGQPSMDRGAIARAARAAQAHDFIQTLPSGYDTQVGERGGQLSGGQRQRITIARAILQDRPILILDEATAFADAENEAALIAALSVLMRGRTVIMVAHRLSTVRDADQILVMDRGRLVESGRHDDLLADDALYARMWRNYERAQQWTLHSAAGECPGMTTVAIATGTERLI